MRYRVWARFTPHEQSGLLRLKGWISLQSPEHWEALGGLHSAAEEDASSCISNHGHSSNAATSAARAPEKAGEWRIGFSTWNTCPSPGLQGSHCCPHRLACGTLSSLISNWATALCTTSNFSFCISLSRKKHSMLAQPSPCDASDRDRQDKGEGFKEIKNPS